MNTVLIKEVKNQPVIFNVDNAVDAARLEALQAVKMAEDLVSSVFGEQSNFADNTTCLVSPNPDNPAFPLVVFDSSKILPKPKRDLVEMARLALPSQKYIEVAINWKTTDNTTRYFNYTPESSGYFQLYVTFSSIPRDCLFSVEAANVRFVQTMNPSVGSYALTIPVSEGTQVHCFYTNYDVNVLSNARCLFVPVLGNN